MGREDSSFVPGNVGVPPALTKDAANADYCRGMALPRRQITTIRVLSRGFTRAQLRASCRSYRDPLRQMLFDLIFSRNKAWNPGIDDGIETNASTNVIYLVYRFLRKRRHPKIFLYSTLRFRRG
jgi:hypothetical protein